MTDIIKRPNDSLANSSKFKLGASKGSFADKVRQAKKEQVSNIPLGTTNYVPPGTPPEVLLLEHRIGLMVDCSGSMSGEPINQLKEAITGFVNSIDISNTGVAIEPFPNSYCSSRPITNNKALVATTVANLSASGGTPLDEALEDCVEKNPLTRGIVISDGEADSSSACYDALGTYIKYKITIDTVHIGQSTGGEELLKEIAKRTGGIYLKFKDISTFIGAFKYLTPGLRGLLSSGDIKSITGADEGSR